METITEKSCIHIYTGNGKGKTTAATGASLRFAGNGGKVLFVRFLKGRESGEIKLLKEVGVTVLEQEGLDKFYSAMDDTEKERCLFLTQKNYSFALEHHKDFGMIVLDECGAALKHGLLKVSDITELIFACRKSFTELILTGRDFPEELKNACDYLTEMQAVKHPYSTGLKARKGIEY